MHTNMTICDAKPEHVPAIAALEGICFPADPWPEEIIARHIERFLTAWEGEELLGYAALVGCSPYFLMPYSDGTALIIPIALIWLYDRTGRFRTAGQVAVMALIGLLGALGYLIKPQSCIPLIAVAMCEVAALVRGGLPRGRFAGRIAAALLAVTVMLVPVRGAIMEGLKIDADSQRELGVAHFLNMGLSDRTDGVFDEADEYDALQIEDKGERARASIASAIARVRAFGPAGLAKHALKKALTNFADGGFAWGLDFARNDLPPKNELSSVIRGVVYHDGETYRYLHTFEQLVWLLVLMVSPFAVLILRGTQQEEKRTLCAMLLSVVGIVCFNMLFEARARYVYVMVPIMLSLWALALSSLWAAGTGKMCKRD